MRYLRSGRILLMTALFYFLAAAPSEGFDWPRWGGPDGNWVSQETGWDPQALNDGPRVLWNVNVGMGHSNVCIKD